MKFESVKSSQIEAIAYDEDEELLGIRFPAGPRSAASEYHYSGVSRGTYQELTNAASIGSYFTTEIKSHPELYPYQKVGAGEVMPPATDNSALAKVDKMSPESIFIPGTMDPILEAIRAEVKRQAVGLDISTESNRKALAALAYKVTKSKTFIESQRKSLVAAEKKRLQAIDAEGRRIWDILEAIAAEVRAPLTAWEQKDKDRKAKHEKGLIELLEIAKVPFGATIAQIEALIATVEAVDTDTFDEYASIANGHRAKALEALNDALEVARDAEFQKSENERLKAEAAERATQQRIEEAARLAKEKAERESFEREQQAAIAAEAERQEVERQKKAAEERAAKAEQDRIDAANKAERDRVAAIEKAEADKQAAIEAERQRVAAEEKQQKAEAAMREADQNHKKTIHRAAVKAIVDLVGLTESEANTVVTQISANRIPNVSIRY